MKTYLIEVVELEHNRYTYSVEAGSPLDALSKYKSGYVETLDVEYGVGGSESLGVVEYHE